MNGFAFVKARTISEAAVAASTTVTDAMTISPEAAGHRETSVVKAGCVLAVNQMLPSSSATRP